MKKLKLNLNLLTAAHDALMAGASFVLSVYIRLGDDMLDQASSYLFPGMLLFTLVSVGVFSYMRLYRGLWRYTGIRDMIAIVKAVSLSILIFAVALFFVTRLENVPRSLFFINWMLLICMLAGPRFLYRANCDRTLFQPRLSKIPVLIIGAGNPAEQFIRDMARDARAAFEPVGILDDNPARKGGTIHNVRIYGGTQRLPHVVGKLEDKGKRPQKIILADDHIDGAAVAQLLEIADGLGIPMARLPRLSEFKHGTHDKIKVQPIAVEDLLGRSQNVLDRDGMRRLVTGKKILITGAGGTIGSELTRQIASHEPAELILFELSEFNLYQIELELAETHPALKLRAVLADVRDGAYTDYVFARIKPEMVFHAAAIKHVPLAEFNSSEAVLTNVFGTRNIAEACLKHGVSTMVMISTDKAVNPTNVMGASKRLAESFCQALGENGRGKSETKFITVRFGNVLGSTGSVVPLFQKQLEKGGPITVTHEEMTRYFMTVREAVELVLQAATLGTEAKRQEAIFVLDMGRPMKILDLATQMIRLAGLRPYEDIEIVFTGLRPGEKLYEELFHGSENTSKTSHEGILLAQPRSGDIGALKEGLAKLHEACNKRDTDAVLSLLKSLVPEFNHQHPRSSL